MPVRTSIFFQVLLGALFALLIPVLAAAQPLKVAVTIAPQAWLVEQIGGELVSIETLIPEGSDPHNYEPKPSQMATMAETNLYLSVGVTFEDAWLPRIRSANPSMTLVPMDKGIEAIPMAAHEHGHDHGGHGEQGEHDDHASYTDGRSHGEYDDHEKHQAEGRQWMDRQGTPDPHVWTDPANMLIMAKNTFDALQHADKKHSETYLKNYFKTRARIEKLERELMMIFAANHGHGRAFMVFHPSWGYFARAHALTQVPIEVDGKEPSPKELAAIISKAKKAHATAIFVQPQRSRKAAEVVAGEIGAKVITADPLARDWDANLRRVAQEFKSGLH